MVGKLKFLDEDLEIIKQFDVKDICLTDHLENQYSIDVSGALKLKYIPSGGSLEEYTLAGLSNWIKDLLKAQQDNTMTLPKSFIHTSDITSWWNNAFNNFTSTQLYKGRNYTECKKEALQIIARDLLKCIKGQACEPAFHKIKNIDENNKTLENFVTEILESYRLQNCDDQIYHNQWNNESQQFVYIRDKDNIQISKKGDEYVNFNGDLAFPIKEKIRMRNLYAIIGNVLVNEYQKETIKPINPLFVRLDGSHIEKDDGLVSELMSHHTAQVFDFLSSLETEYNAMHG